MRLLFGSDMARDEVFKRINVYIEELMIKVSAIDSQRPWGGFFVIDDFSTDDFINTYFPDFNRQQITQFGGKLSPKILLVAPGQKLSWQYHERRAELWRSVAGPVGYIRSYDDNESEVRRLAKGDTVQFNPQERHRLVGLDNWGVVAEIWQHTDAGNPSDEDDIIRLADDYGRQSYQAKQTGI
jgi:mannose-6-phosphate isomerase